MKTIKQMANTMIGCIFLMFIALVTDGQNTVSISAGPAVNLTFAAPTIAGNPLLAVTDNSRWLNYNITGTTTTHSISARLETALPDGLQLQIVAGVYQGTWGGSALKPNQRGAKYYDSTPLQDTPGIPATVVTLSLIDQVIVSNIGTFDTGTGAYLGHQLTYTMRISDCSKVRAVSSNVSVLYTITQP